MADEREGQDGGARRVATRDVEQSAGRKANDAKPLNAAPDNAGPERYPAVRQDDAVERTGRTGQVTGQSTGESRSFDPPGGAPQPTNAGKVGPDGKPAEGSGEADPADGKR